MKAWYVLYTKPHAEHQVFTALTRKDVKVYLPEITVVTSRQVKKKVPFFPNYLFAQMDLDVFPVSALQWIPGLRYTVTFDGRPATVPPKMISLIRYKLDEMNRHGGLPPVPFNPGDTVRVTEGPFEGMVGIFEEVMPANRVRILLTILGNINRAQVDATTLEKASPPELPPQPQKRPRRTRGRGRRINR